VIYCGDPPVVENGFLLNVTSRYLYDEGTAQYGCRAGYQLEGSAMAACTIHGWHPLPVCTGKLHELIAHCVNLLSFFVLSCTVVEQFFHTIKD